MVVGLSLVLSVISEPGSIRGWTARYIAPLYLVMPLLMAIGIARLGRIGPWLAALPAVILLGVNLAFYSLPGSASRQALTAELSRHQRLRERLAEAGVDAVVGDFWLIYHVNFDSGRKLGAVPFQRHSDYFDVAGRLPAQGLRWAMVATNADELWRRAARVGARGTVIDFEQLKLFLPDPAATGLATSDLLQALRGPS
jgi:hypothetical protein